MKEEAGRRAAGTDVIQEAGPDLNPDRDPHLTDINARNQKGTEMIKWFYLHYYLMLSKKIMP